MAIHQTCRFMVKRGFFGEPANLEHPIDAEFARHGARPSLLHDPDLVGGYLPGHHIVIHGGVPAGFRRIARHCFASGKDLAILESRRIGREVDLLDGAAVGGSNRRTGHVAKW